MRKILIVPMLAALLAQPLQAMKPPREESPASKEALDAIQAVGAADADDEIARAIAAADAFPLGTLQNPIRTAGPEGAQAYLARLRCPDGSIPKIGAKGEGGVDTYGSVTDLYRVTCGTAAPTSLIFDLYHEEHVESRPPAGFRTAR